MSKKIPCEIYSRVCGYFRPLSSANKGKQEEIKDRYLHTQQQIKEGLEECHIQTRKF